MMLRALIVEDEPLARQRLRDLLVGMEVECIGEAATGEAALTTIHSQRPDLLFLDVRMPGLSGLELLQRLDYHPAVIFTTAHDDYAVQAFELEALDYLLKPFGRARLEAAVHRARRVLEGAPPSDTVERAKRALEDTKPLTRLLVRRGAEIAPLLVCDIQRLEAADDYVAVIAGGRRHLVYLTLVELQKRLDPDRFLRVHRSHVVNLDHVQRIVPCGDGRLQVEMRDGALIVASRAGSRALRQLSV